MSIKNLWKPDFCTRSIKFHQPPPPFTRGDVGKFILLKTEATDTSAFFGQDLLSIIFIKSSIVVVCVVNKKDIINVLKTVTDPELQIDVWTLGLIYEIEIKDKNVNIKMTFTTPMCPYGPMLIDMIKSALEDKLDIEADVDVVFDPPWEPSEDLKAYFGV